MDQIKYLCQTMLTYLAYTQTQCKGEPDMSALFGIDIL